MLSILFCTSTDRTASPNTSQIHKTSNSSQDLLIPHTKPLAQPRWCWNWFATDQPIELPQTSLNSGRCPATTQHNTTHGVGVRKETASKIGFRPRGRSLHQTNAKDGLAFSKAKLNSFSKREQSLSITTCHLTVYPSLLNKIHETCDVNIVTSTEMITTERATISTDEKIERLSELSTGPSISFNLATT